MGDNKPAGKNRAGVAKLVLVDQIEPLILTVRGHKVLIDRDLATLYDVPT